MEIEDLLDSAGVATDRSPEQKVSDLLDSYGNMMTIDDFGPYVPEEDDPNVLVKGRWLERGGAAFIVSTAGTGKSILATQIAFSWSQGIACSGLVPNRPLRIWIFQSEDSPTRMAIDREDITAELTETRPDINWTKARRALRFVKFPGVVGAAFLERLGNTLDDIQSKDKNAVPDVILMNPFLAYIGGQIADGTFVTPFLRGGDINRQSTNGLQYILETYNTSSLLMHHTPKPPSGAEIAQWLKSPFPEYQGAGSADITNWGRSFITMMRVPDHPNMVCLTAGKNGNELGWDMVGGARRHYLAYSGKEGVSGLRHAWRELTDEEFEEVAKTQREKPDICRDVMAKMLRERPMSNGDFFKDERCKAAMSSFSRELVRRTWNEISRKPEHFGLVALKVFPEDKMRRAMVVGLPSAARDMVEEWRKNYFSANNDTSITANSAELSDTAAVRGSIGTADTAAVRGSFETADTAVPPFRGGTRQYVSSIGDFSEFVEEDPFI